MSGFTLGLCLSAVILAHSFAAPAPPGSMLQREVNGDLPLAVGGQAQVAIIAPDEADMQGVVADLAAFVRDETGVSIPVVESAATVTEDGLTLKPEYHQRHLILIGNALNNRAILPLYCRWLDAADGAYPGDGGYELRTVVNPYGTGCNSLVLGASTPTGAERGLETLKAKLTASRRGEDLILPQLLDVRPGPGLEPAFSQAIAQVKANPERQIGAVLTNTDLAELANDSLRYAWTGERAFAERAAGILREMNRRFDGSYYHGDIRTCDDYALEYAVRGWLMLQHAGVLTNEELLESDRNLYKDFPLSAHGPGSMGSRHLASGSMAWFLALDGLLTYGNPDPEARAQLETWREGVRQYFHGACRTYRGDVDQAQDFGAMENVFRYAIHDGYWEYFSSGWAAKTITQMLMNVDNEGWYSGLGGYGESMPGSLDYPVAIGVCLPITAFVERRGDLRWIRENVPNLGWAHLGFQVLGVHAFDMGSYVPADAPRGALTGLTLLPLSEYHWELAQKPITNGCGPVTVPLERCLDKLMLRQGFGKDDQYLLLNGFQNTVMGCLDGNAIVRFCDEGQVLLFQSTQEEGHDTKNAVWVSNGRNDEPLEGCVEKGPVADLGDVCFSSTTLPRYHGTDWERNLFWRKGGVLVVMDKVTVQNPGKYVMACTWRSPRYARVTDDGQWESRTDKGPFTVCPAVPPSALRASQVTQGRDGETAMQRLPDLQLTSALGNDRFCAEPPWVLRETRRLDANEGDMVDFQNAIGLGLRKGDAIPALTRLSDSAVCLALPAEGDGQSTGGTSILMRGSQRLSPIEGDPDTATVTFDGDFAWLGCEASHVAGLKRLSLLADACVVTSTAPVDMVLEREGDEVAGWVRAEAPTTLELKMTGLQGVEVGQARVPAGDEVTRFAVPVGTHELHLTGAGQQLGAALEHTVTAFSSGPGHAKAPRPRRWAASSREDSPLQSVWSHEAFRSPGRRERNLTVTSRVDGGESQEGPYAILADSYFHHTLFSTFGKVWNAEKVELTFSLPETQTLLGLRLHSYYGSTDFAETRPEPGTIAEVAVSNDGYTRDVRVLSIAPQRRYQYLRGCYGGQFFSEVVDTVAGLARRGSQVRVTLTRAPGAPDIRLGRLELITQGPDDSVPVKAQPILWGKDSAPHWAAWTPDRGQLTILDAMGKVVWERDLWAAITGICCADLDGDGTNELVVTAADWKVHRFDSEGHETIVRDWRGAYDETGGKYYYGGTPHGVGVYEVPGQKQKDLAIGHYYSLTTLGLDGSIKKTYEGYACYWQDFLDSGVDLNDDGCNELLVYSETPWQTKVNVVAIDSTTQEPLMGFPSGNGGARIFETLKIGDETCVAVGSHKGCGIYSLTKRAYKWNLDGEVFKSSFFLTDLEGDGDPEMLIGQRDGFLLAVDVTGEVVRKLDVGQEVLAVGALRTEQGLMLLASTASGTLCYDATGQPLGTSPLVAQRFMAAEHDGKPALLALRVDGGVEMVVGR